MLLDSELATGAVILWTHGKHKGELSEIRRVTTGKVEFLNLTRRAHLKGPFSAPRGQVQAFSRRVSRSCSRRRRR